MNNGKCLIVIDMQTGIFHLKQTVFNQEVLVDNINRIIGEARKQKIPIIFTQQDNKTFLQKDTAAWQIVPELNTKDDDIRIYKSHPSIFDDTELEQILHDMNVNDLFIGGLITNGCIQQACTEALRKGFMVTLISDAHSTFYKNPDTWNRKLEEQGVTLATTQSLLN